MNRGVVSELRASRPDAVAGGGWNQPAFWQDLASCKALRAPLLVWIESTSHDRPRLRSSHALLSAIVEPGRAVGDSPADRGGEAHAREKPGG